MKPICIYHGHCDDGFAAAWAVRAWFGPDCEFYPGIYQKPPPDVTGRNVIMVDFSYKRPVLEEMAAKANGILILDHHKTAEEDLRDVPKVIGDLFRGMETFGDAKLQALFDMNRSGAGIAWDYFSRLANRKPFINYIEDRDLWRKALPGGDEFTIALRSYPQDFEVWDGLVNDGPERLIEEGKHIQRYYRMRVEELKRSSYVASMAGYMVAIANAPYFAASEVAGELAESNTSAAFGASYFEVRKGEYQYSLRSRGDFDVSAVARTFGGGGHKAAAGFSAPAPVHESTGHWEEPRP